MSKLFLFSLICFFSVTGKANADVVDLVDTLSGPASSLFPQQNLSYFTDFKTGSTSSTFDSATLDLASFSGSVSGVQVTLYHSNGLTGKSGAPTTALAGLTGYTGTLSGTETDYTFTSTSTITLAANTIYWIGVTATSGTSGAYLEINANDVANGPGWIGDVYLSGDGFPGMNVDNGPPNTSDAPEVDIKVLTVPSTPELNAVGSFVPLTIVLLGGALLADRRRGQRPGSSSRASA